MAVSTIASAIGFSLGLFAFLLVIVGFSTSNWMEPDSGHEISTQLEKLGLWEVCFKGYSDNRDGFGRIYNGCWWIFARQYDGIRKYINPGWFKTVQGLMTVSVIFSVVAILFGLMLLLKCFPSKLNKHMAAGTALLYYKLGIFIIAGCTLFGSRADTDRTWLKAPQHRHLAWSFWLMVFGGILGFFAGMCYTVYWLKIRKNYEESTAYRAHELRHYDYNHSERSTAYKAPSIKQYDEYSQGSHSDHNGKSRYDEYDGRSHHDNERDRGYRSDNYERDRGSRRDNNEKRSRSVDHDRRRHDYDDRQSRHDDNDNRRSRHDDIDDRRSRHDDYDDRRSRHDDYDDRRSHRSDNRSHRSSRQNNR